MQILEQQSLCIGAEEPGLEVYYPITVIHVDYYGKALPRGLIVHNNEIWIVSLKASDDDWRLEEMVKDVADQGGKLKWRNYLERIGRWPWTKEDTQEIKEIAASYKGEKDSD